MPGYMQGTGYDPYSDDELNTLQGLMGTPDASSEAPAGYTAPQQPAMGAPQPPAMPVQPAPEAPMAPPPAPPLDLSLPPAPAAPKGLVRSEVGYTGVPDAEREKLMSLHQQLMDQQLGATDRAVQTEGNIAKRNMAEGEKQIGMANVTKNSAEMSMNADMAAKAKLRREGDEWAAKKDDPSKAFEGSEWAGVLGAIGIAAGAFAKNMGWQKDNPVQEAFDDHINRTVAAQREQKNSSLNQIALRIGDLDDAIKIKRAQMNDAIANRITLEQQHARDKDTFDRLGTLAEDRRLKAKEELVSAYQGMVPREEQKFAPPKPAAGSDPIERLAKLAAADKALEGQGVGPDDPARKLLRREMGGVSQPTAAEQTNKEQAARTATEAADKAAAAEVAANKFNAEEAKALAAKDAIDRLALRAKLVPTGDPQNPYAAGSGMVAEGTLELLKEGLKEGATAGLYKSPLRADFDAAAEAYGRSQSGGQIGETEALGDERRAGFVQELGGDALGAKQLADRINAGLNSINARLPPKYRGARPGETKPPTREQAGFRRQSAPPPDGRRIEGK